MHFLQNIWGFVLCCNIQQIQDWPNNTCRQGSVLVVRRRLSCRLWTWSQTWRASSGFGGMLSDTRWDERIANKHQKQKMKLTFMSRPGDLNTIIEAMFPSSPRHVKTGIQIPTYFIKLMMRISGLRIVFQTFN